MATKVVVDELTLAVKKLAEIKRQLEQQGGYPFKVEKLNVHLQKLIEGQGLQPTLPAEMFAGIIPQGWTPVGDIAPAILTSPSEIEGVGFHHEGEGQYIPGEEMIKRAPTHDADLGFADLKMCHERQGEIPKELRDKVIGFSKAIARHSRRRRYAFYLYCLDEHWIVGSRWLGRYWDRRNVLGRRRKPKS
jgi:hypothetical protein